MSIKIKKIKIPIYDWTVSLIELSESDTVEDVKKIIKRKDVDPFFDEIIKKIELKVHFGGEHIYDPNKKESMILIYICKNKSQRNNILCHEKRHVEDRIIETCGLEGVESAAFIAGYLGEKLL